MEKERKESLCLKGKKLCSSIETILLELELDKSVYTKTLDKIKKDLYVLYWRL